MGINLDERDFEDGSQGPCFDEASFMEVNPRRRSKVMPPTSQEILELYGVPLVPVDERDGIGRLPRWRFDRTKHVASCLRRVTGSDALAVRGGQ